MNKQILYLILTGLFCFLEISQAAAQSSRLYFAGYMGLSAPNQSEFSESSRPASGDIAFDNTQSFAGALGIRLSRELRLEAEISYRKASMDRISVSGQGSAKLGGHLSNWLYMINGYYDLDMSWKKITPFISGGVGVAFHEAEIIDSSGFASDALSEDWGFAWQAGSGLKYRVKDNFALTGSYRYLGTAEMQFDGYDFDFSSHEIRIGIEYDIPVKR